MVRVATAKDRDLFIELWKDLLLEHHKNGWDVMPTAKSMLFFLSLFDTYIEGKLPGVIVFGANDEAVALYGSPGELAYDSRFGRIATGWGIYMKPEHRKRGWAKRLRAEALKVLKKKGIHTVVAGILAPDEKPFRDVAKYGSRTYQIVTVTEL